MPATLTVTVCELSDDRTRFESDWTKLVAHVEARHSDLVLLPEMPFAPWCAVSPDFDQTVWDEAVQAHEVWLPVLADLTPASVVSTRPVTRGGRRLNEGFAWSEADGYRAIHDKRFLPDEKGYWEARWYSPGEGEFRPARVAGASVGLLICTEQWSLGHAQRYGKTGADLILTPRATGRDTVEKWLTGGRTAAIVSGAFGLSSNWAADAGGGDFGGSGWIIDPDGRVLARTSRTEPFQTRTIDLDAARAAKTTYPRYALD